MAEIICPMCGRPNPEELDVCQFCEAQLKSVTDELSRSQPPIKPGEDPKQVDTGELEPVLPQWLRDIRQKAREATEESEEPGETEALEEAPTQPREEKEEEEEGETPLDLLAGLASQSEEVEEIPDWLASIREGDTPGSDLPDMMADLQQDAEVPQTGELGGIASFAWDSGEDETEATFPDQDLPADIGDEVSPTDGSEIPDWLKNIGTEDISQDDELVPSTTPSEEPTETVIEEPAAPAIESDMPEWLAERDGEKEAETESIPPVEEPAQITGEDAKVPDWLASFGSDDAVKAEPGLPTDKTTQPPEDGDTPDWLSSLRGEETAGVETTPEAGELTQPSEEERETPDWLSSLRGEETAGVEATLEPGEPAQPSEDETEIPDWLSSPGEEETAEAETTPKLGEPAQPSEEEREIPDWLESLRGEETAEAEATPKLGEPAQPSEEEREIPDWLESLRGKETAEAEATPESEEPAQPSEEEREIPDWLESLSGEETVEAEATPEPEKPAQPSEEGREIPDWLSPPREEETAEAKTTPEPGEPVQPGEEEREIPDWLSSPGEEETAEAETTPEPEEPAQPGEEEREIPDWLSPTGEEETAEAEATPEPEELIQPAKEEGIPDWLESPGRESQAEEVAAEPVASSFAEEAQRPPTIEEQPADFVTDEGAQISNGDMDAIFSMEMPDWLEDIGGKEQAIDEEAEDETVTSEDLSPASLPDWVQAMRPVESVISEAPDSDDVQEIEEIGPFAGLAGVLPPIPDYSPSSKPKAYALKLVANEEQRGNAALLERLLASEARPIPIKPQKQILSQRILRWLISVLMLILISGVMFSGTQNIPIPVGMPQETWAAVQIVDGIPENAPVLLIFDYEAARAGEMEVSAGGLIDHMISQKHPRLALLASKPTGAGLAGRFMSIIQAGDNYQDDKQILNLGYLPGGAAGVLGFSKNPKVTVPVAANGSQAWESAALQGVNKISDFATIILLSDDAENARIWIEQLEADNSLGDTSFIVVSSGQSGPMILPYLQSGQVNGMVIGLDNGASIEQFNSGRPGLARSYWDAFGFGLLAAVAIIILGSFWNLVSALQARRANNHGEG